MLIFLSIRRVCVLMNLQLDNIHYILQEYDRDLTLYLYLLMLQLFIYVFSFKPTFTLGLNPNTDMDIWSTGFFL